MDKQNKTDKTSTTDVAAGKPSWDHINTDLKGALDTWEELTDKMANKLSPDEEQLRDIKSILGTLKDKLKAFDEEEPTPAAPTSDAAGASAAASTDGAATTSSATPTEKSGSAEPKA